MEIKIKDGRGQHRKPLFDQTRNKIIDWFNKNPYTTMKDCSKGTGLSYHTVRRHIKLLKEDYGDA